MAKVSKALAKQALDYRMTQARFESLADVHWLAGHRAGSRLTKAERKVIEAAVKWSAGKSTNEAVMQAVEALQSKKVRK